MRTVGPIAGSFAMFLLLALAAPTAGQTSVLSAVTPPAGDAYGGKTLVPAIVACTDLPTATAPAPPLWVVSPHGGDLHESAARGELVVLNAGTPQGLAIGQRYFARRLMQPLSREVMSSADRGAIRTTGWLTVVAADERFALARVDYACVGVNAGDYLEPYVEPVLPAPPTRDGPTNFNDLGRVLFGVDRREIFGPGDILSIDRGSSHGMAAGSRVAFYRDRRNGTPLVEIGAGVVVEVAADSAKVALERTSPDVKTGDYFGVRVVP